jgi:hypothetical protein
MRSGGKFANCAARSEYRNHLRNLCKAVAAVVFTPLFQLGKRSTG